MTFGYIKPVGYDFFTWDASHNMAESIACFKITAVVPKYDAETNSGYKT